MFHTGEVEEKLGASFSKLTVISHKTQVVAGNEFLIMLM